MSTVRYLTEEELVEQGLKALMDALVKIQNKAHILQSILILTARYRVIR